MTAQNQRYAADTEHVERDDVPAVIVTLETLSELSDLVHRHRLAVAALKQELAELADELLLREAQAYLTVQDAGRNEPERKAKLQLQLASDGDYQTLRRRERDIKRAIAELEADVEKALWRLRITLQALPYASAVDATMAELGRAPESEEAP
jgi:uncharacterized coiled-coil protein SlyX